MDENCIFEFDAYTLQVFITVTFVAVKPAENVPVTILLLFPAFTYLSTVIHIGLNIAI